MYRRRFVRTVPSAALLGALSGCAVEQDQDSNASGRQGRTTGRGATGATRDSHDRGGTETAGRTPSPEETQTRSATDTLTESPTATSAECAGEPVTTASGALPVHSAVALPAKATARGIRGDEGEHVDVTRSEATGGTTPTGRVELEGLIDGTGTLAMNGGTAFTSYWTAPETGTYTATAAYFGTGAYDYAPVDDEERDYTICLESNLSVLRDCREVVASTTRPDLRHANDGMRERVAEQLLETLAYALVAPYLGPVGRIVAKAIVEWVVDLELREPTSGSFFIDPASPQETAVTFSAREGETYAVTYTPSVGFAGESRADWVLTSTVQAKYLLDALRIDQQ
jgi:hypothetical protein